MPKKLLLSVMALAFAAGMALSWPLFGCHSDIYGLVPFAGATWLASIDPWIGWLLMLSGTVLWLLKEHNKSLLLILTGLVLLCLADLTRLQAWTWQYGCMLLLVVLTNKEEENILWLRLLLGFTYFWSGIHKLNVHFQVNVFDWMTSVYDLTKPLASSKLAGYSVGAAEMILGLSFLWRRTAPRVAPALAILFHVGILALLLKSDWNRVVWPWNLCMIVFCAFLIKHSSPALLPQDWYKKIAFQTVILLFGILPAGLLMDIWPAHLSLSMYSGRTIEGTFIVQKGYENCLPASASPYWETLVEDDSTLLQLPLDNWSTPVLGTPAYPGEAQYKLMTVKLCDCLPSSAIGGLKVTSFPIFGESKSDYYDCKALRH